MDTVITNNPLVRQTAVTCVFLPQDAAAVLRHARDMIHRGCKLAVHPLAGNIRPERLRYKTLVLSGPEAGLDLTSLTLIETALAAVRPNGAERFSDGTDRDLQLIDADIIYNAVPALFSTQPV